MKLHRFSYLLALFVLNGCSPAASNPQVSAELPVGVKTATAQLETLPAERWLSGTVFPAERAVIAARTVGQVIEADFEVGTVVENGQVLVRLEADELAARVVQSEAAYDRIKRDHARERALLEKNAATPEAVNALADRLREAEARLDEARSLMAHTTITAPFSGVVTGKAIRTGDLATLGTPLLTLEGFEPFELRLAIPASLPLPAPERSLRVLTDKGEFTARIVALSPAADVRSRTREAVLRPQTEDSLDSGAFVRVAWPDRPLTGIWIPAAALRISGQMEQVFVVENGVARMRLVKTGARKGTRVQIHAGVRDGEQVIVAPPPHLRDAQIVEVRP